MHEHAEVERISVAERHQGRGHPASRQDPSGTGLTLGTYTQRREARRGLDRPDRSAAFERAATGRHDRGDVCVVHAHGRPDAAVTESMTKIQESGEKVLANVERVIVGKHHEVRLALVALMCKGHLLIEDVPGTGKTVSPRRSRAAWAARSGASSSRRTCCRPTSPGCRSTTRRPRSSSSGRARS